MSAPPRPLPLPGGGPGWGYGAAILTCLSLALAGAHAQTPPAAAAPAASAPAQQVEIRGNRGNDIEQRRQSTAAKIVIGRDEIERFGDATVGELLKRLPGVTMPGPPGRGGPPRMRGMGGGYTQLLLDGERMPPGFSLETLSPDQIERIEILRAPTAETGARAIAGTINVITREGVTKRLNDLKIAVERENDRDRPSLNWVRNIRIDERWNANLSLSAARQDRLSDNVTTTQVQSLTDGSVLQRQAQAVSTDERREHFTLGSRLQWVGERGQMAMLMPFAVHSQGSRRTLGRFAPPEVGAPVASYDRVDGAGTGRFSMLRLNGQWRQPLADGTRLELRGGYGGWLSRNTSRRQEFDAADTLLRTLDEPQTSREKSGSLNLKASRLLENDHLVVGGLELERALRTEERKSLQTLPGGPTTDLGADLGDNLRAASTRSAAYLQDEWNLSPNWAAHAGLRFEQITTQGAEEDGTPLVNRSSVASPLLHAVWKPDPKGRDQVRISLTRSYRAPGTGSLIARPSFSQRFGLNEPNAPTYPDRAGNPDLRPELATGIDIAFERYLGAGGVLSANLFHRRIKDLIRTITTEETVSWSTFPRYVARPQNVGNAVTQGIELEAKFRLTEFWPDALPMDLRSNASFYRSRVSGVPGPDNRLDQQPHATLNLGADYRLRSLPLTLGANLGYTPGFTTRLSETQWQIVNRKRVVDAYALWTLDPAMQLRLSASNLGPHDHVSTSQLDDTDAGTRESSQSVSPSYVIWQLRLELKL